MKVGIDFGTTNCTIGNLFADGRMSVSESIPSVGAWQNGVIVFGKEALEKLSSASSDVYPVRDLKMLLGEEETISFGQTRVSVVELAEGLIRHLIQDIYPNESVDSAVIATPVRVPLEHRKALICAAGRAGVRDVQLVYEPTAALIGAHRFEKLDQTGLFLIVDWGGGTLDIAVVKGNGDRYEEITVGGDVNRLGGTQIDAAITERILENDPDLRRALGKHPGGIDRFRSEVEQLKIVALAALEGPDAESEEHFLNWLDDRIYNFNPEFVFDVVSDYADKAAESILNKLRAGNVDPDQITDILFAGGVCQAPEIRDRIMIGFPNVRLITKVAGSDVPLVPQALTGAGCTEITGREIVVELATNIGVRQCDDSVCIMLEKGLPVHLNSFRRADFVVTDPSLQEAILDIGQVKGTPGQHDLLGWHGGNFESLEQIFIPAGKYYEGQQKPVLDTVKVSIGVEKNLSLRVCAETSMAGEVREHSITGIPLALRFI